MKGWPVHIPNMAAQDEFDGVGACTQRAGGPLS